MIIAVLCLSYKTIPYLKSRKKRCLINKRSDDVGRKTKFVKRIWDWLAYPEKHDKKYKFAKNEPVGANW